MKRQKSRKVPKIRSLKPGPEGQWTAGGHHFGPRLRCVGCKMSYVKHQRNPEPCKKLSAWLYETA